MGLGQNKSDVAHLDTGADMMIYVTNGDAGAQSHDSKTILMMSTLAIQPLAPAYGTPVITYALRAYLKAGWTIYFIAGFKPDPIDDELVRHLRVSWFAVPWLRALGRLRKIGFFARTIWWMMAQVLFFIKGFRIISKHKVNLIYTWDVDAAPAGWLLSRVYPIPWVARYLGTFLWDQKKKRAWKLRSWQQVLAYKLPADMVIMTDDGTFGDRVLRSLGVDMKRVRFWMNGVDRESFTSLPDKIQARRELGINSKWVLLTLSRLHSWKRVDRAIQALPEILRVFPNTVLLVVGDGPERKRLERLAMDLGVAKHIRFEGAVPHRDVPKYLAAADVFLSFYDLSNVGNPLLEAMMAGKCIVTLNNGDTGRFIKNGENGVLLEYEDLPRLPEIIKELLANEDLRNRLGANARKFAEENFWSWQERIEVEIAEVNRLIELYKEGE